jgi:hypothetical protein
MKITKSILAQIIKEELDHIEEMESPVEFGKAKASTGDVRQAGMAAAKEQGEQGITAQERGIIKQLSDMLVGASKETNILSGTVISKIKHLAAELQKVLPADQSGAQE